MWCAGLKAWSLDTQLQINGLIHSQTMVCYYAGWLFIKNPGMVRDCMQYKHTRSIASSIIHSPTTVHQANRVILKAAQCPHVYLTPPYNHHASVLIMLGLTAVLAGALVEHSQHGTWARQQCTQFFLLSCMSLDVLPFTVLLQTWILNYPRQSHCSQLVHTTYG